MDDGDEAEPTGLPGPAARPVLDGLRLTLFEALSSKRPVLGQMYLGALAALDRGDPESLAQSAHSMRELLEKLPTYVEGIPQERRSPSLTEAARNLATSFNQAKDTSGCWTDDDWRGEIDASLRKLLRKGLPSFLAVAAAMKPPRRTTARFRCQRSSKNSESPNGRCTADSFKVFPITHVRHPPKRLQT